MITRWSIDRPPSSVIMTTRVRSNGITMELKKKEVSDSYIAKLTRLLSYGVAKKYSNSLNSSDHDTRIAAIRRVNKKQKTQFLPHILQALLDDDISIRAAALDAIQSLYKKNATVADSTVSFLEDSNSPHVDEIISSCIMSEFYQFAWAILGSYLSTEGPRADIFKQTKDAFGFGSRRTLIVFILNAPPKIRGIVFENAKLLVDAFTDNYAIEKSVYVDYSGYDYTYNPYEEESPPVITEIHIGKKSLKEAGFVDSSPGYLQSGDIVTYTMSTKLNVDALVSFLTKLTLTNAQYKINKLSDN